MLNPKKILFLDKVLTKPFKEDHLRGVEIFNIDFIIDLLTLGHEVALVIHPTWEEVIAGEIPISNQFKILRSTHIGGRNFGSLAPLWKIRKKRYDALFLANVGNGILIPYHFIKCLKMAKKSTLLAHKVPGSFFVKNLRKDTKIVSVNKEISKPFEDAGFPVTDVYYGIVNCDQFYKKASPRNDGIVRFGMLGDLDSKWKGSDRGIEAFLSLPPEVGEKAELHLAAFRNPPELDDPRIIVHPWIDRTELGDYLRSIDLMLALSRDLGRMMETFCQSMVQGMMCGVPQITTDLEIFKEKLDAGGGIVTHNQSELIAAMVKFAQDPSEISKQGEIASRIANERYAWNTEAFLNKYL